MAKFNIINKAEALLNYVYVITNKSPKKLRCDIVPALRNEALNIMSKIISANRYSLNIEEERHKRLLFQHEAQTSIRILEAIAESCIPLSYLTAKQVGNLSEITGQLYEMIDKWIASDASRCIV